MNTSFRKHPVHGRCLFADNGTVEIGVPLDFGLRIAHLSFVGEKNVFFEEPEGLNFLTTTEGWRLRGGHRLWLAPESEKDYHPDNDPIAYELNGNSLLLRQPPDPRLKVEKSFEITFDGDCVNVAHRIKNLADEPLECALWALTVMAPGGFETIPLPHRSGGMSPLWHICAWDYTDLGDKRLKIDSDKIEISYQPIERKLKIGVGHPAGPVRYENGGTVFVKHFEVDPNAQYTDTGVSFETFFSLYMTEIESLSPLGKVLPGQTKEHTEKLQLLKK